MIIINKDANTRSEWRDIPLSLVDLEFKAAGQGKPVRFKGYGSVWDRVDSYGDTVVKGAFLASLGVRQPVMLFGHNMNRVPGKWVSAEEDDKGLLLEGELTPGHSEAKDLEASMRHGAITGLSIGGYTTEAEWLEEDGKLVGRRIKAFDLFEVSVVSMPAEAEARIEAGSVKSAIERCETIRQVEQLLREGHGFTRSAAEALIGRVKVLMQGDPAAEPEVKADSLLAAIQGIEIPTSLFERKP